MWSTDVKSVQRCGKGYREDVKVSEGTAVGLAVVGENEIALNCVQVHRFDTRHTMSRAGIPSLLWACVDVEVSTTHATFDMPSLPRHVMLPKDADTSE